MFPKKGSLFPGRNDRDSIPDNFPAMVARALRAELGPSHRAAKTLMRWTGASERTVKQWLTGTHGPRCDHLVALIRESDAVFESVMIAADRHDVALGVQVLAAQISLDNLLARLNDRNSRSRARRQRKHDSYAQDHSADGSDVQDDRKSDRNDDRENDRDPDREVRPIRSPRGTRLNPRQRWYLDALGCGMDIRAADLTKTWKVSDKTARRDLAGLKALGMISFMGSRRAGRYRITR